MVAGDMRHDQLLWRPWHEEGEARRDPIWSAASHIRFTLRLAGLAQGSKGASHQSVSDSSALLLKPAPSYEARAPRSRALGIANVQQIMHLPAWHEGTRHDFLSAPVTAISDQLAGVHR